MLSSLDTFIVRSYDQNAKCECMIGIKFYPIKSVLSFCFLPNDGNEISEIPEARM